MWKKVEFKIPCKNQKLKTSSILVFDNSWSHINYIRYLLVNTSCNQFSFSLSLRLVGSYISVIKECFRPIGLNHEREQSKLCQIDESSRSITKQIPKIQSKRQWKREHENDYDILCVHGEENIGHVSSISFHSASKLWFIDISVRSGSSLQFALVRRCGAYHSISVCMSIISMWKLRFMCVATNVLAYGSKLAKLTLLTGENTIESKTAI